MSNIAFVRGGCIFSDSRATKEITALAQAGHRVRVIGWDSTGQSGAQCAAVFAGLRDRVSFTFYSPGSGGPPLFSELYPWYQFVTATLEPLLPEVDWVHAVDLGGGWPALQVCEPVGKRLVYDIYDYCIDSDAIPPQICDLVEKMEISVINYADTTIICTEERREQIARSSPRKVVVIHNSPDVTGVARGLPEQWDYAYCGSLRSDRLVGEILSAFPEHPGLSFVFAGVGSLKPRAEELAGTPGFSYFGRIPYARVLDVEARSLVLSAIYSPDRRNHRLCAPNKFYEALALGKPVIVCRGTGIDRIVEEHDLGAVISYDAGEFYDALSALLADPARRAAIGVRGRRLYEEKYNWSIMRDRLLRIYS